MQAKPFICKKEEVKEILEYHQLKCADNLDLGYNKITAFLDTMSDEFGYNDFCSKLEEIIRPGGHGKLIDVGDRFKNGFLLRMRRYKVGADWKDLNKSLKLKSI